MQGIAGKVAIVTGASSGIGAAVAADLAAHGARVMLAARREQRLREQAASITAAGGDARWQAVDVVRREQVEQLVGSTIQAFGRIDVIFNNAGIMPLSMMDKLRVDEWEQTIDVNIKGVLYGVAAALPIMLQQGSGHIINVSSVAGHVVLPSAAVYCASKFAVRVISEGLRRELAGRIRVTNVSPGAIATELGESVHDPDAREMIGKIMQTALDPQAIADAVRYAIAQPDNVSINEIIVRPTHQTT